MSFSYLYILQRQWNRDVNSILNSEKQTKTHFRKLCAITPIWAVRFTVTFVLPTQRCRLLSIFEKPSSPAAITDLACCTWLKTSMSIARMAFFLITDVCEEDRYWNIWSGLSEAPSCLSGTAPAGKLWSNIQMRLDRNGPIYQSHPEPVKTLFYFPSEKAPKTRN